MTTRIALGSPDEQAGAGPDTHFSAGDDSRSQIQPQSVLPERDIFFGAHPQMRELEKLIKQIGASDAPVLIRGETGVGKEILARELHAQSSRAGKRFLKLNCAALPSELVESELFGYEKGAFTGAFQKKLGMFDLADEGTIFLDEIGDMAFGLQAKLLQVLQDQEFQRLGGKETIRINVRVIAATHCDLELAISQDRFRQDLYYRLNVISVWVPPLRERKEDIFALAEALLHKHCGPGSSVPALGLPLCKALMSHSWPGNVRELENVMRKLLALNDQEMIAKDLLRSAPAPRFVGSTGSSGEETETRPTILEQVTEAKRQAEKSAILAALDSTQWNRKKAAIVLKVDYKALLYKMKTLSIPDKMTTVPLRVNGANGGH
jgi:transcriptional regulator with PAS, ATPase and Fis domain